MSADEPASSGTPEAEIRVSELASSPASPSGPSIFRVRGDSGSQRVCANADVTAKENVGDQIPQPESTSVSDTEDVPAAIKSVKQNYVPSIVVLNLLETFRMMVNEAIRIGVEHDVTSMKRLSSLSYSQLSEYKCPSYYKVCAISRAAGILASRKKSIRRVIPTKSPYAVRQCLTSCYGFKIEKTTLKIPIAARKFFDIPLNNHTLDVLSETDSKVRSFTLTARTVSLTISKKVPQIECTKAAGLDRNLRNLAYGNRERVIKYDLSKAVKIAETTKEIVSSFKRNDVRIRKKIASKYGRRSKNRIGRLLNCVTKDIVEEAYQKEEAIVLEDIEGIRSLYRKGNRKGRKYRGRMNSWPFFEAQRQVEYKAVWKGVPVIHLTRGETRGTTVDCAKCGERLQSPVRDDLRHRRQLWCPKCRRWVDRDVNAVENQAARGRLRFDRSLSERTKGEAGEAMTRDAEHDGEPLILRVDASKLIHGREPMKLIEPINLDSSRKDGLKRPPAAHCHSAHCNHNLHLRAK